MNSNVLTRFVIVVSFAFSANSLNAQTGPLGFTAKMFNQGHAGSVCDRAVWLRSLTSKPQVFVVNDEQFNKNTGTTFVALLRDPDFAIIGKYWRHSGQCPPEEQCCTIEAPDAGMDEYVVSTKSQKIVHSPTEKFRSEKGGKAYFYSALQPLYRPNTSLLTGFLVTTYKNPGDQAAEVWVVDVDGTPRGQLFKGHVLGNHGCVLSPNQKYLACEQLGDDWLKSGFLLAEFNGTTVVDKPFVYVKWNDNLIPFGAVIWSSDSAGFVFYTCHGYPKDANVLANRRTCASGGWLVYYDVNTITKVKAYKPLAEDWMPSFFCSRYDGEPKTEPRYPKLCHQYGGPNLGSDIAVASRVPGSFFYSALKASKDGSKPRRVIGSVATSRPVFEPLTLAQPGESGHPALSPDGKVIAFSAASEQDKRALLYTINICTRKIQPVPMESLATDEEVYNPVWRDPLKVSTLDCGVTTQ